MDFSWQALLDKPVHIAVCNQISDIWVYFLAAAVMEAMAVYAWRYRKVPAARYMAAALIARASWLMALVMISVSQSVQEKMVWNIALQSSVIALLPLFPLIALHITECSEKLISKVRQTLYFLTAFFWLAMLTNDWHGWWLRGITLDAEMVFIRGPLQLLLVLITYLTTLAGFILCIGWAFRASGLRRWRALAVPAGVLVAMIGYVFWGKNPQGGVLPYLPLGFMFGGMIWIAIFYGLRIFNLMELAERAVMKNMNDSLLVIDDQGIVVEMNPAARTLFADRITEGQRFAEAASGWPELAALQSTEENLSGELSLNGLEKRHHRFHISPLTGWWQSKSGMAIVLSDISAEKKAQAQVMEQQKAIAIMTERRRLGRELHDGEGQVWSYLILQFQALRNMFKEGRRREADARLAKLIELAGGINEDVRESIVGLKSSPEEKGLISTLRDFVSWYEKSFGICARLSVAEDATIGFSPLVNLQVLRIIQETMTNTRKYANASEVNVKLFRDADETVIVVSDDGEGFSVAEREDGSQNHYGIEIMRERATEIGGRLEVESTPGCGTVVTLRLPQDPRSDAK